MQLLLWAAAAAAQLLVLLPMLLLRRAGGPLLASKRCQNLLNSLQRHSSLWANTVCLLPGCSLSHLAATPCLSLCAGLLLGCPPLLVLVAPNAPSSRAGRCGTLLH